MRIFKKVISMIIVMMIGINYIIVIEAADITWNFSEYMNNSVTATGEQSEEYSGLEIHLNTDDTVTDNGVLWNSPGSTTSDSKVVSNNRYIKYTATENGEISITFEGDGKGSGSNYPRMYMVVGDDESCMSKNNSDSVGVKATASDINSETTLTGNVIAGRTYYIWPYCYNAASVKFTVSSLTFSPKTVTPVTSLEVVYNFNGTEIKRKEVVLEDCYEGETYTYISENYITDDNGKYYVVGEDFNEDIDSKTLNSSSTGVNPDIKKDVTLTNNTVITYNVKETDIIFYDEWENLLDSESTVFNSTRYWASGGNVTSTTETKGFYTVPETGYYQLNITGGAGQIGMDIFRNIENAEAASSYEDTNAVMSIKSASKNSYYGNYTAKTVFLNKDDVLTIKGYGTNNTTDKLDYLAIRKVDSAEISGTDGVSILPGGMKVQYTLDTPIEDSPEWSVDGPSGIEINQEGVLTVTENASEGVAQVTASLGNGAITVTKDVKVEKAEIREFVITGTSAMNIGEEKQYGVTDVTDQFGNNITDYVDVSYASSDLNLIEVNEIGIAKSVGKGSADIGITVSAGDAVLIKNKTVVSDNFCIVQDCTGDITSVDVSDIVTDDNIAEYTVTTANTDGQIVSQYTIKADSIASNSSCKSTVKEDAVLIYAQFENNVLKNVEIKDVKAGDEIEEIDGYKLFAWKSLKSMEPVEIEEVVLTSSVIEVDTTGAAKVEISPVYIYEYSTPDTSDDMLLPDCFADGDYSFEITKAPKNQYGCVYDLYINGDMIGNNVNEKGIGREFTKGDELVFNVKDITVDIGTITLSKRDFYSFSGDLRVKDENKGVSQIVVSKSPTIAKRTRKVYLLGDSLVAKYYGEPKSYDTTGLVGTARTGWGQQIHNFFNDNIDVHNLANSGQWAKGLQETAFSGVIQSAVEGDYLILESGWNDKSKSNAEEMKQAVIEMVDECEEHGIIPVLVTPNSSSSTFSAGENTQLASTMRETAIALQEKYDDVIFVDLAKLSHEFLSQTYGADTDAMTSSINLGHAGSSSLTGEKGDNLHLSYLGAMKYAEIVAQSMADNGVDFINKDFTWSIEDKSGNTISVQVK